MRAHRVLMSKHSLDDVSYDFDVTMAMHPKAPLGLHEIVVHDAQRAKRGILGVAVFGKAEVEP